MFLPMTSPFPSPFIASFGLSRMASWLLIVQAYTEIGVWRRIKDHAQDWRRKGVLLHSVSGQLNTRSEDPSLIQEFLAWKELCRLRWCFNHSQYRGLGYRRVPLKLLSHVRDRKPRHSPKMRKSLKRLSLSFVSYLNFISKNIIGSKIVQGQLNVHMQNNKEQN